MGVVSVVLGEGLPGKHVTRIEGGARYLELCSPHPPPPGLTPIDFKGQPFLIFKLFMCLPENACAVKLSPCLPPHNEKSRSLYDDLSEVIKVCGQQA